MWIVLRRLAGVNNAVVIVVGGQNPIIAWNIKGRADSEGN